MHKKYPRIPTYLSISKSLSKLYIINLHETICLFYLTPSDHLSNDVSVRKDAQMFDSGGVCQS